MREEVKEDLGKEGVGWGVEQYITARGHKETKLLRRCMWLTRSITSYIMGKE